MDQNTKEIGKFQQLIIKNPIAFVAAVFFVMFWVTYFLNIRKNDNAEEYWKELYEKEKDKNDDLTYQLLINAGVIKKQDQVITDANTTLRKETESDAKEILNSRNNEK